MLKPREKDIKWFEETIERIQDKDIKRIVTSVYEEFKDDYLVIPGSVFRLHHDWTYGQADHVRETIEFYDLLKNNISSKYRHDSDIVIGCLLIHDIEKCTRFFYENKEWHKKPGSPLGHFEHPAWVVEQTAIKLGINPHKPTVTRMQHILRSHHGDFSDIKPKFIEARIVCLMDYLSAKLTPTSLWGIDVKMLTDHQILDLHTRYESYKNRKGK